MADKNLENTVDELEELSAVNRLDAQQKQQQKNDRRKEMLSNDDGYKTNEKNA